jgi:hypothetical protein
VLVALAAAADADGAHGLAGTVALAAVPLAAVDAIGVCGHRLDRSEGGSTLRAVVSSLLVALLVLSCALRSSAVQGVPPAAVSSLLAALALVAFEGLLALTRYLRRAGGFWPAKP